MLNTDDFFDASDLGLSDLNPRIQVNISEYTNDGDTHPEGTVTAVIDVSEDFAFHRDLDRKLGDKENQLFAEDDEITDEAEEALKELIAERYDGIDFTLQEETAEGFTFSIALDVPSTTTVEELSEKIWTDTKIVKFHNEVDPGTFNCQYLFGTLITEKLKK
jgi:hypothetical protein